jgi:hypothetical protein
MPRYAAALDARVLVPVVLADTLLRVGEKGLHRPPDCRSEQMPITGDREMPSACSGEEESPDRTVMAPCR